MTGVISPLFSATSEPGPIRGPGAVADHRLGVLVLLALVFGLRRGEALGLMWNAFGLDARTLRVTHSVKRLKDRNLSATAKTHIVIGELKTRRSRRVLCLTPELVEAVKRHKTAHNQEPPQGGGHAGIAITKDVHGHLLEGDRRAATEAISSALLEKQTPVTPEGAEDTG
ncbi:hypothetical protein ACIBQ1_19210 [Nonomuraea sp. NPDC050153]|uniref:hypothetical protein n=1 Tax=Nonomuraea sp. NPDC050153 TaxID=3364359 RepID=UPI0037BB3633